MGGGSGRDGGEARGGRGISARLPHPQQRCEVISLFFFSLPSITPEESQEMNFKATPWDAHPGLDWEWWGRSCPSPLPACSSGPEAWRGSAGQDTLRGCRADLQDLLGPAGAPTVY